MRVARAVVYPYQTPTASQRPTVIAVSDPLMAYANQRTAGYSTKASEWAPIHRRMPLTVAHHERGRP